MIFRIVGVRISIATVVLMAMGIETWVIILFKIYNYTTMHTSPTISYYKDCTSHYLDDQVTLDNNITLQPTSVTLPTLLTLHPSHYTNYIKLHLGFGLFHFWDKHCCYNSR